MAHLFTQRFFLIACFLGSMLSLAILPEGANASQITEADWQEGVVVLNDNTVLNGEVHYDYRHDLVLLRPDVNQSVKVFTVHQIQSFRYYDLQDNIIHNFLVVDHSSRSSYSVRSIYEVVSEGEVLYLRRHNHCPLAPPQGTSVHTVAYDYFAYYQGVLVRSHQFEKSLLPALTEADPTLLHYIKEKHLKPYSVGGQVVLVEYFNRQLPTPVASLSSSQ